MFAPTPANRLASRLVLSPQTMLYGSATVSGRAGDGVRRGATGLRNALEFGGALEGNSLLSCARAAGHAARHQSIGAISQSKNRARGMGREDDGRPF